MIWFSILGVLSCIVSYIVLTRGKTERRILAAPNLVPDQNVLSIDQARAMVDELIEKGVFKVETAAKAPQLLEKLGTTAREFFSRYSILRTKLDGFELSAADLRPSEYMPGYISVGHSEDWDVIQKPGSDEVCIVEGGEACEEEIDIRFPSIYHLMLDEADYCD